MSNKRQIDIIIPVYGVENVLAETLASLRAQTFQEWTVYCVNDGNQDNCNTILDDTARLDNRFYIIHQRNRGVSHARNRALERITAKYFYYIDSDDLLHPQALETLYTFAERHQADIVHLIRHQRFTSHVPSPRHYNIDTLQYSRIEDISQIPHRMGAIWENLFKTSTYGRIRFMPNVVYEDVLYLYDITIHTSAKCVDLDVILYYYRQYPTSIMHQKLRLKHIQSYAKVICATVEHCLIKDRKDALQTLRDEALPFMLKSQWGALRRNKGNERKAIRNVLAKELKFLFQHDLIPRHKHKLHYYLAYRMLAHPLR